MKKESFIRRQETQIAMYLRLLRATKACHETLPKFDGKVLNVRLVKAFKEINQEEGVFFHLNGVEICVRSSIGRSYPDREPDSNGYTSCSYISTDSLFFRVVLDGNRIDAASTLENLRKSESYFGGRMKELQFCIDNYDQHTKESNELEKSVMEYKKRWPAEIQDYITINKK